MSNHAKTAADTMAHAAEARAEMRTVRAIMLFLLVVVIAVVAVTLICMRLALWAASPWA